MIFPSANSCVGQCILVSLATDHLISALVSMLDGRVFALTLIPNQEKYSVPHCLNLLFIKKFQVLLTAVIYGAGLDMQARGTRVQTVLVNEEVLDAQA